MVNIIIPVGVKAAEESTRRFECCHEARGAVADRQREHLRCAFHVGALAQSDEQERRIHEIVDALKLE